jgi:urease accessory protein
MRDGTRDDGSAPGGSLLALLQLSDGLFPAGGFVHSLGLETYVQDGRIIDGVGLEAFLVAQLEGGAGPVDAVAVALACRFAAAGDVDACLALDHRLDAMKPVPELRAASCQMGRQTLRVVSACADHPVIASLARAVEAGDAPGHHGVAFGATLGATGVEAEAAATAYLYATCAMLVGAGLRLLPLGQTEGQRVLTILRPRIVRLASAAASADVDDVWSFSPGLELAAIRHAGLDARLFRS